MFTRKNISVHANLTDDIDLAEDDVCSWPSCLFSVNFQGFIFLNGIVDDRKQGKTWSRTDRQQGIKIYDQRKESSFAYNLLVQGDF